MTLMNMSPEQREAAVAPGPVAVIAGPGSGKTLVIIERVAHLIGSGVGPEEILAITFTNKATDEMRSRLAARIPESAGGVTVSTFHALAARILRADGERLGIPGDFAIARDDSSGTASVGREGAAFPSAISLDRLVPLARDVLVAHRDVARAYERRFRHVIVDEYQDTDDAEAELMRFIAGEGRNICVVGDPEQAIYGFRGALPAAFDDFFSHYPDARALTLAANYRSSAQVCRASDALVPGRASIPAAARHVDGVLPRILSFPSARAEAFFVAREIEALVGGADMVGADVSRRTGERYSPGDIAVLYRLNAVGRECEKILASSPVPFRRVGAKRFFARPEIADVLARVAEAEIDAPLSEQIRNVVALRENGECPARHGRRRARAREGAGEHDRILVLIEKARASYDHLGAAEARRKLFEEAAIADPEDEAPPHEAVTLMSAHAAKGCEFPVVFVIGLEDGLFPHTLWEKKGSGAEESDGGASERESERTSVDFIAEERRLLYVAATRAKERLYLTSARRRFLYGRELHPAPSRFLSALSADLAESFRAPSVPRRPQLQLW